MSIKVLYLPKIFIPPQNKFLATPLAGPEVKVKVQGQNRLIEYLGAVLRYLHQI